MILEQQLSRGFHSTGKKTFILSVLSLKRCKIFYDNLVLFQFNEPYIHNGLSFADKRNEEKNKKKETKKLYKPHKLLLEQVGHVDSGKSTLCGRLLHLLGQISNNQMRKYEKEAKDKVTLVSLLLEYYFIILGSKNWLEKVILLCNLLSHLF